MSGRSIVLLTKDGERVKVPLEVAQVSVLVREITDEDEEDDEVSELELPLPNVTTVVLRKVLQFCEHYVEEPLPDFPKPLASSNLSDYIPPWYVNYIDLSKRELFSLVLAANYLDVSPLLDLGCAKVASQLKADFDTTQEQNDRDHVEEEVIAEEDLDNWDWVDGKLVRVIREENRWDSGVAQPEDCSVRGSSVASANGTSAVE